MGYIGTEKEYGNYHLRLQYRWGTKKFQPRYELKRDAGLYYHILGPDAVWPKALQFQIEQTNVGDLIALYGFQLDTWIDPKTRGDEHADVPGSRTGGRAARDGGRGDRLPEAPARANSRSRAGTPSKSSRAATRTTHVLNGQVVNQGRNVRLVDPEKPGTSRPITRGRIALEIEAAEIYFRNVEIKELRTYRPVDDDTNGIQRPRGIPMNDPTSRRFPGQPAALDRREFLASVAGASGAVLLGASSQARIGRSKRLPN